MLINGTFQGMRGGTLGDNWGAETSPSGFDLQYAQTADSIAPGILDYANTIKAVGESWIDAIARARMTVAMTDAQRQLLDIQIDRARQGLPPLNTQPYTSGGVNIGGAQLSGQTLLILAALVVVAIMVSRKR